MKALSTVILDIPHDTRVSFSELHSNLSRLRGVQRVNVNLVMEKVTVDFNPSKSTVDEIRAMVAVNKGESKGDKQTRRHHSSRQR